MSEFNQTNLRSEIERALLSGCSQTAITEITREIQKKLHRQSHAHPFGLSGEDFTLAKQIASGIPYYYITHKMGLPTGSLRYRIRTLYEKIEVSSAEEMYFAFLDHKIKLLPFAHKTVLQPQLTPDQIQLLRSIYCHQSIASLARKFGEPKANLHGRVSALMKKLGVRSRIELARYWKEVLDPSQHQSNSNPREPQSNSKPEES